MLQPASAADSLPWVRWLLNHSADLPAVLAALEQIPSAVNLAGKWAALKTFIDLLVALFADAPAPLSKKLEIGLAI
ncbi:MAG TPA: hypothetical protein VFE24_15085 [Pirellulales bacterium]|jgi:hypothetical protein|nr:hypothetical protein [Pirellulales bacterium]